MVQDVPVDVENGPSPATHRRTRGRVRRCPVRERQRPGRAAVDLQGHAQRLWRGAQAVDPLLARYEELGEQDGGEVAFLLASLRVRAW